MKNLSQNQVEQEKQYIFPYHYLSLQFPIYEKILHRHYLSELELVSKQLALEPKLSFLDVGCGDGRLCYEIASSGVSITGIDYSERAIAFARAFNPEGVFHVAELTTLPSAVKFDRIALVQVLEHIPPCDIPQCISELGRLLGRDGLLVVTVPTVNIPLHPKHYQHFTPESLEAAFSARFKMVSITGHIQARRWAAFNRLRSIGAAVSAMPERTPLKARVLRYIEAYFDRIKVADKDEAHTIIASFRPL